MAKQPDAIVAEPWLFPAMALLHTSLVAAPLAEVWFLGRPFELWACVVSVGVLALATTLRVWTLRTIGRSWNVRVVVPNDIQIATTGPYRFIRHPNYLVVILEIAALPLFHNAWMSAIGLTLFNAIVLYYRIRTEEASLSKIPAWSAAMASRKRLIPGIF